MNATQLDDHSHVELVTEEADEFSKLLNQELKPSTEQAREAIDGAVRTLAREALGNSVVMSSDAYQTIQGIIAAIDGKLSEQINEILHHEDFQKLESSWRGLHYLVNNTETDELLKIRFMPVSKQELGKTLKKYKPQDWNVLEVVVKDNVAHCTCNGELLEDALKLPETGPIGLEADRGQMEYRHIQIKE